MSELITHGNELSGPASIPKYAMLVKTCSLLTIEVVHAAELSKQRLTLDGDN